MKRSAGILVYRLGENDPAVLLVHPGGPFWRRKDAGAWSLPKGEIGEAEEPLAAALREFAEETGVALTGEAFEALGEVTQGRGKRVLAWAFRGDLDAAAIRSDTFEMEWPPRSGRRQSFPEVDKAGWFDFATAREKILPSQRPFLDRLEAMLSAARPPAGAAPDR